MQTHNTTNTHAKQRDGMQGKDDYYTQSPRTKSQMNLSHSTPTHTHKGSRRTGTAGEEKVHSRCTHKKVMRHKETAGRKTSKKACLHLTGTYTHTHTSDRLLQELCDGVGVVGVDGSGKHKLSLHL